MPFDFSPNDVLFRLALVLIAGIVGGELFGLLRLPKVTGWICTGILIRATATQHQAVTGLYAGTVHDFAPYMNFVLGYIAFTVGAALHFASLRNSGRRLGLLLLGEALFTPAVVTLLMYVVGGMIAPDKMTARASLLLAAIAIAGAPGTTILVVQEARARGILTRTLVAAVALIDMVAVGAFAFVSSYLVEGGTGQAAWHATWSTACASVAHQFAMALVVGTATALVALVLARTLVSPAFIGPTMVAVILGAWGGATGFGISGILACTIAGIVVSNLRHDVVRSAEAYLQSIGGVLFAAFYTFAGMNLDFSLVLQAAGLVLLYFVARFVGKYIGAYSAMSIAEVPAKVRNNLGLALIPHGGVAVGLILLVESNPQLADAAEIVTTVGLAALAINQLVGPSGARFALFQAGDAGKDHPRLLDFLDENHIAVDIVGETKEDVIRALADQLYTTPDKPSVSQEEFVLKVFEREQVASTCLSQGLMVPHAILDEGQDITGVLGISSKGLDLGAPDGHPVHAVLLLATPETDRKRHLEVLAAFARAITRNIHLREQLYHARSAAYAYDVLHAEAGEDINYFLDDALARAGMGDARASRKILPRADMLLRSFLPKLLPLTMTLPPPPRLMVIGAHPDDADISAGGLAARYSEWGFVTKLVSLTDGSAGHYQQSGAELAQRRRRESAAAGRVVGAEYEVGELPDAALEPTLEARESLIRMVRKFAPDVLLTHRPNDYHPDHRSTSQLVQDASYLLTVPSVCPDVPCLSAMPVIMYLHDTFNRPYPFTPSVLIPIDDVFDRKVEMVCCHESQVFEWLPHNGILPQSDNVGRESQRVAVSSWLAARADLGSRYADLLAQQYPNCAGKWQRFEAFELCEYGTQPDGQQLQRLFPCLA